MTPEQLEALAPPPAELLAAIVNSSDDAIVSKNLDGIITSWNWSAQRMFGYTSGEAVGRSVLMLVPRDRVEEEPKILARLRRGERVDHFETIRVRKNGEHFPVSLTISPVKDLNGHVVGASKIARDITDVRRIGAEREQLLESERAARSQAERANRMKDEFLATVSHELRTPLNAILGWTQLLKEGNGPAAEVAYGLEIIDRNARMQAQLIDDLLDLGRIASGKMTLDVEAVEIGAVTQEAIVSLQHAANLKRIRIKTLLQSVPGGMMGDKQRLQQAVANLLSNAIKFTPENGGVLVSAILVNSHVEIAIADNGCGIAPDFLPRVFERFRQADSSTTRRFGGLGIGLALVKQIVELHGGTARAESAGVGQGAVFTISLPVIAPRSASNLGRRDEAAKQVEPPVVENLAGIKVLAVDDDSDSIDVLKRVLTGRQATVQTASSAEEALAIFPGFQPDIVLSDIGMPVHDGYELIRRLRRLPGGATVPAVALTALARIEDRMRVLNAGFQAHLPKPITAAELVAVVRSLTTLQSPRAN